MERQDTAWQRNYQQTGEAHSTSSNGTRQVQYWHRGTKWNTFSCVWKSKRSGIYLILEWQAKRWEERSWSRICNKRDIVAKLTEMPHPVSDRIMTTRIPLTKDRNATIVSAYAPTMTNPEENKDTFYSQLKGTLRNIPSTDKLLPIGDFNARIGRENDKWPSALGKYGIGKCNPNGELLLALCTEFDLIVTNTMFKQKGRTQDHMDASPLSTWAYDRLHHHQMPG